MCTVNLLPPKNVRAEPALPGHESRIQITFLLRGSSAQQPLEITKYIALLDRLFLLPILYRAKIPATEHLVNFRSEAFVRNCTSKAHKSNAYGKTVKMRAELPVSTIHESTGNSRRKCQRRNRCTCVLCERRKEGGEKRQKKKKLISAKVEYTR